MTELSFADSYSYDLLFGISDRVKALEDRLKLSTLYHLDDASFELTRKPAVVTATLHLGEAALAGFGEFMGIADAIGKMFGPAGKMMVPTYANQHRISVGIMSESDPQHVLYGRADDNEPGTVVIMCNSRLNLADFQATYPELVRPRFITSVAEYVINVAEHVTS